MEVISAESSGTIYSIATVKWVEVMMRHTRKTLTVGFFRPLHFLCHYVSSDWVATSTDGIYAPAPRRAYFFIRGTSVGCWILLRGRPRLVPFGRYRMGQHRKYWKPWKTAGAMAWFRTLNKPSPSLVPMTTYHDVAARVRPVHHPLVMYPTNPAHLSERYSAAPKIERTARKVIRNQIMKEDMVISNIPEAFIF